MNLIKRLLRALATAAFYLALIYTGVILQFEYREWAMPAMDKHNLPADFALFATWRDGAQTHCQVFFARELARLEESYPGASLAIPDPAKCVAAIRHFEQNEARWPVQFGWQAASHWPYISHSFEQQRDGSLLVELSYRRDDDDYNKSRYLLKNGKISAAWQLAVYGPGLAVIAMLSGLALALAGYVARWLYRIARQRAKPAPPRAP